MSGDSIRKVCLSKLLNIGLVLLVLKLLGKYPAIFFGVRIYLLLKAWGKCWVSLRVVSVTQLLTELYFTCKVFDGGTNCIFV